MGGLISDIFGGGSQTNAAASQANATMASSQNAFRLGEQQLAWNKQLANQELSAAQPIIAADTAGMKQQQQIAQEQWNQYQNMYQPVEKQMVSDAMNYDSPARMEKLSSQAEQDVASGYDANLASMKRDVARYGGSPNSGNFLSMEAQMGDAKARDEALAANTARQNVTNQAISLRAGAANLGRGLTNSTENAYSGSVSSGQGASNASTNSTNSAVQAGSAASAYTGNSASLANAGLSGSTNAAQLQQNSSAGLGSMLGTAAAMFLKRGGLVHAKRGRRAPVTIDHQPQPVVVEQQPDAFLLPAVSQGGNDGGDKQFQEIRPVTRATGGILEGPGTETSDSIPVMASKGEYVLNADSVKAFGKPLLDKMNAVGLRMRDGKSVTQRQVDQLGHRASRGLGLSAVSGR